MKKQSAKLRANDEGHLETEATREPTPLRKRGRPRADALSVAVRPVISREDIIAKAAEMAIEEPLSELSIVGLAKEFGVTTALIHYYAGSRDDLISGVVNLYFKVRVERLGLLSGIWRDDIERHATEIYGLMKEYGGVLRYLMSHNRFRIFQQVGEGETDYGMVYMNRLAEIFRAGGFTAEQSALGFHLLSQYVMSSAYSEVSHQLPAKHEKYILGRIRATPVEQFPASHFFAEAFSKLDGDTAFAAGLAILLNGIESWPRTAPAKTRRPRKARPG